MAATKQPTMMNTAISTYLHSSSQWQHCEPGKEGIAKDEQMRERVASHKQPSATGSLNALARRALHEPCLRLGFVADSNSLDANGIRQA